MENKDLKRRIIEISYKKKLSHLGSCLTAVDIIDFIYSQKRKDDIFILSSGHAGLAWYVVLEKYNFWHYKVQDSKDKSELVKERYLDAEKIFDHHGVHPDRCADCHITCSSGSLGHGLGIAVGMALAERNRRIYCLVSDGEMAEGSIYEALNVVKEYELSNLQIHINCNSFGAYRKIYDYRIADILSIYQPLDIHIHKTEFEFPFLKDQDAHYHILTDEDYKLALELLQ